MACVSCEREMHSLSENLKLQVSNGCQRFEKLSTYDQYLVDDSIEQIVNFFYDLDPKKMDTKSIHCSLVNQYSRNYLFVLKHLDEISMVLQLKQHEEIVENESATIYQLLGILMHGIFPNHFYRFATLNIDIKNEISKITSCKEKNI